MAGSLHIWSPSGTARLHCRSCLWVFPLAWLYFSGPSLSPFVPFVPIACPCWMLVCLCCPVLQPLLAAGDGQRPPLLSPLSLQGDITLSQCYLPCVRICVSPASTSVSLLATVMVLAELGRTTVKLDVLPQQHWGHKVLQSHSRAPPYSH